MQRVLDLGSSKGRHRLLGKRINVVERLSDVECYILAAQNLYYIYRNTPLYRVLEVVKASEGDCRYIAKPNNSQTSSTE
jgi:hypothetical protein